jgi:cell division protein FtsN
MNKFIIGLVLGIAIAGGLAYYLNNAPSQFVNKVTNNQSGFVGSGASAPVLLAPGTKYQVAASNAVAKPSSSTDANAANASAPSYDFYDVLQGKKSVSNSSDTTTAQTPRYFIQAGSFSSQNLANDMKARLALLGVDARIKSQQDNGKMINRIIIGPFNSEDEATDIITTLKDNDISATLIKIGN